MNASYAAELWIRYLEPLRQHGIRLGAPGKPSFSREPRFSTFNAESYLLPLRYVCSCY
jgi:hypothetical protein